MNRIKRLIATVVLLAGASTANAGIPVIDVANLAQSIEQVIAWGQQYGQMVEQIQEMRNQYAQLQNTYNSMTGNRGLGTLLNGAVDQAARRYLPAEATQLGQLGTGVTGFGSLQATIARYKSSVSTLPSNWLPTGSLASEALSARVESLATQQALGEAAYTSSAQRTTDIESLISTVGVTDDPKGAAEIGARIAAQQAMLSNEATRAQALAYLQQVEKAKGEQRSREVLSTWRTYVMPPINF